MEYKEFLNQKVITHDPSGFEVNLDELNPMLFDWQKLIVRWALYRGKAAIFAGCGLGKTPMQLEWANQIITNHGGRVLILAPLAVSSQTVREGKKFNIKVNHCRKPGDAQDGINITNYEMAEKFNAGDFKAIVLDESSILKGFMGKMKQLLISMFAETRFKLCCTATPAPNDHVELGTHSEFLNVLSRSQMLSSWFVNDGFKSSAYRIKGHATEDFWRWVSTWAVCLNSPRDIGFETDGFDLPELKTIQHSITVPVKSANGKLADIGRPSATELYRELRETAPQRTDEAASMINDSDDFWIAWCNTNYESELLAKKIPEAVEVKGSMKHAEKEKALEDFGLGKIRVMIGKPSMCGFGLNLQHCNKMAFVGLSYSFEQRYQAIRRCWRFGQTRPVEDHVILSPKERMVFQSVQVKEKKHLEMENEMESNITQHQDLENNFKQVDLEIHMKRYKNKDWTLVHGDCVEAIKNVDSNSMGFSIFSPPFSDLFVYSNSYRDMGNCKNDKEFFSHFQYLIPELFRIVKPGRLCAVHCSQLPLHKYKDGVAGMKDFRGDIIRAFQEHGWIYHSEVCIWKDPVVEMQRTKAHGLLHKQICKDSTSNRQGMADYLVVFRKYADGEISPVKRPKGFNPDDYVGEMKSECHTSIDVWQRYASPVWFDIRQSNVLNVKSARTDKDQRHLCPLQLDVIERAIHLWTNKGDTVFTPYAGVGSEVYSAVKLGRKGYGIELKKEYIETALDHLKFLHHQKSKNSLMEAV